MIGPELAYEHCWSQFPDRDIIIMHTDMTPLPDDVTNQWYNNLLNYARTMPHAGMLACNLLYPLKASDGAWLVQSAGGYFQDGKIGFIGGGVVVANRTGLETAQRYDDNLKKIRLVAWVTFGGVYIRRGVLSSCGRFDRRYRWAYVMDVDYCLEARRRGFELFQVPVNLTHFEARTTKPLMSKNPQLVAHLNENFRLFYEKWSWWLQSSGTTF